MVVPRDALTRRHTTMTLKQEGMDQPTNVLVPTPAHFEKLFLSPEHAVAGKLRLTFANPTPVALAGFLLANTPAAIDLMGWGGAGAGTGNTAAGTGTYFFLGAMLLYIGAIGEWILGNTFPCVVFFTFGGFWGAFGATLTPFFNAIKGYETEAGFYNSFAMFLVFMGVLCFAYLIASLRTNICLFSVLFCYTFACPFLAASYFWGARGRIDLADSCRIAAGSFAFASSMIGWYLWFSLILESVDFPLELPVGDLSCYIKGKCDGDDCTKGKEVDSKGKEDDMV